MSADTLDGVMIVSLNLGLTFNNVPYFFEVDEKVRLGFLPNSSDFLYLKDYATGLPYAKLDSPKLNGIRNDIASIDSGDVVGHIVKVFPSSDEIAVVITDEKYL